MRPLVTSVLLALAAAPVARADEVLQLIARVVAGPSVDADRAASRLAYLGPDRAGPAVRALLASPISRSRLAGTSVLVLMHDPAATPLLIRALDDEDWEVRRNAATALGGTRARSATRALVKRLQVDARDKVRMAVVKALVEIGTGASGLAGAAAKDNDFDVRIAALDAVARLKDRSVRSRIRPLLSDQSELIRFTSARALGWLDDGAGRQFLEKAFASGDLEQMRRAITVATDVPASWPMLLFEKGLDSSDAGVAFAAATALAKNHDRRGARFLARLSMQDVPESALARRTLEDLGVMPDERERLAAETP